MEKPAIELLFLQCSFLGAILNTLVYPFIINKNWNPIAIFGISLFGYNIILKALLFYLY